MVQAGASLAGKESLEATVTLSSFAACEPANSWAGRPRLSSLRLTSGLRSIPFWLGSVNISFLSCPIPPHSPSDIYTASFLSSSSAASSWNSSCHSVHRSMHRPDYPITSCRPYHPYRCRPACVLGCRRRELRWSGSWPQWKPHFVWRCGLLWPGQ
jgi:hypothetical protein